MSGSPPPPQDASLVRRGQFHIGTHPPDFLRHWPSVPIDNELTLSHHPELGVVQVSNHEVKITLVGYIIDAEHPEDNDRDILERLLRTDPTFRDPFQATKPLGGRWVMTVSRSGHTILFTDPAGLRQVFYAVLNEGKKIQCASEAGCLAMACGLAPDPVAEEFRTTTRFGADPESWWPGDKTNFSEIKRLLPNFFLDLQSGESTRFWPAEPGEHRKKGEIIDFLAWKLPLVMDAFFKRGRVMVSLTAGHDSRPVLAACRAAKDRFRLITVRQQGMSEAHPDVAIPCQLAKIIGMEHDILLCDGVQVRESFRKAYQDSIADFHEKWLPDEQLIHDTYQQRCMITVGSVADFGRMSYEKPLPPRRHVTPEKLAYAGGFDPHPFAIDALSTWLRSIPDFSNFDIGDLYHWEVRTGRWLAMSQLEFGTVWQEIFCPFNNREIIEWMLSASDRYRCAPYRLHKSFIAALWPELMSQPFNPHKPYPKPYIVRRAKSIARKARNAVFGRK